MATVIIGVDPHKRLHALVAVNHRGKVLARPPQASVSSWWMRWWL